MSMSDNKKFLGHRHSLNKLNNKGLQTSIQEGASI